MTGQEGGRREEAEKVEGGKVGRKRDVDNEGRGREEEKRNSRSEREKRR